MLEHRQVPVYFFLRVVSVVGRVRSSFVWQAGSAEDLMLQEWPQPGWGRSWWISSPASLPLGGTIPRCLTFSFPCDVPGDHIPSEPCIPILVSGSAFGETIGQRYLCHMPAVGVKMWKHFENNLHRWVLIPFLWREYAAVIFQSVTITEKFLWDLQQAGCSRWDNCSVGPFLRPNLDTDGHCRCGGYGWTPRVLGVHDYVDFFDQKSTSDSTYKFGFVIWRAKRSATSYFQHTGKMNVTTGLFTGNVAD